MAAPRAALRPLLAVLLARRPAADLIEAAAGDAAQIPSEPGWQCSPVDKDVEYLCDGAWSMRFGEVAGPEACCAKCQAYIPQCKVWTWLGESGDCWVKDGDAPRSEPRRGAVSGRVTRTPRGPPAAPAPRPDAAGGPGSPAAGAAQPTGAEAGGAAAEGSEAGGEAAPSAAGGGQCALLEPNIKYTTRGSNWSLKVEDVVDGAACCEECARDERCALWTWVRPLPPSPAGACWLKGGEVQRKVLLMGFVSGLPGRAATSAPPAAAGENASAAEEEGAANTTAAAEGGAGEGGACTDPDIGCRPGQYVCLEGFSIGGCSDSEFDDPADCARSCRAGRGPGDDNGSAGDDSGTAGDGSGTAGGDAPDAYRGACEDAGPCRPGEFHCLAGGDNGTGCFDPAELRQYNLEHGCTRYCMTPEEPAAATFTTTAPRGRRARKAPAAPGAAKAGKAGQGAFAGDCEEAASCAEGQYLCLKGVSKDGCSPTGDRKFFDGSHGCRKFCRVAARPTTTSAATTGAPAGTSASPPGAAEAGGGGNEAGLGAAPGAALVVRRMFRAGGGDPGGTEDGDCDQAAICSGAQDYCVAGVFEGICSPRGSLADEAVCTRYCAVAEEGAAPQTTQEQAPQTTQESAPPTTTQAAAGHTPAPTADDSAPQTTTQADAGQTPAPNAEESDESGPGAGAGEPADGTFSAPVRRSAGLVKGICYTPVPAKAPLDAPGASYGRSDFASRNASKLWSSRGRGDLGVIAALGANAVRVYGSDPSADHAPFLEEARRAGLEVIAGLPDFPYSQAQESCLATDYNCFPQAKELYKQSLRSGFLTEGGEYHESLRLLVLLNEPDQGFRHHGATTVQLYRATISALDGVLDAEAEVGFAGAPPNFTVTFSFAMCHSCSDLGDRPGLGQMAELRGALLSPEKYGYKPKHDLWEAYQRRFVNSVSTADSADDFQKLFLGSYDENFQGVPLLVSEYHAQNLWVDQGSDLEAILKVAASGDSMLTGILFYEFQVRYDLKDQDLEFGIFGLGDKAIAKFNFGTSIYSSWCLDPAEQEGSQTPLFEAVQQAFGGRGLHRSQLCASSGLGDEELEDSNASWDPNASESTTDAVPPPGEPVEPATTLRGFLTLSAGAGAGLDEDRVAGAVQVTLSVWLNLSAQQVGTSVHASSSPLAPSMEWQVSYRVDVPDSRYPYTRLVSDAIVQQPDAFEETLRQRLVEGGVEEAELAGSAFGISGFTGLQGPEPTSTRTSITTMVTTTQTTTTTRPWTKLTGFLSMVATEATKEQLEEVVRSSLGMRLNIPASQVVEISVFPEDRRLLAVDGQTRSASARHTWDASYTIRAYEGEVASVKNLAHFIGKDPATFVSTMRGLLAQKGLQDSSLTPEALQVVVFSELLGGTTTTVTRSTGTTTAAEGPAAEPAAPEEPVDVPLDDSMSEPDVAVPDSEEGGEPGAGLEVDGLTFDCHDGEAVWTSGWSPYKISWCCEHEQVGCEATTSSDPYDCQAGLSNWERGWSASKMAWCCNHRQLGCQTTEAPSDPFDCSAGYAHWQRGWSEGKTSWCCENKRLGCDPNEEGPGPA